MLELEPKEYQEIVFLTGSKKGFGLYLGLEAREMNSLWISMGLVLPTDYLRSLSREDLESKLAEHGKLAKMADRYGVSESFLRTLFPKLKQLEFQFTEDQFVDALQRYKSIRLMARCLGNPESHLRREADRLGLDIAPHLDYSIGHNSNAKGRRAELAYAEMREAEAPGSILEDLNLTQGSQASADFIDAEYGVVNVKSSRQWKYKASTRKEAPHFWKFSTRGRANCEALACMAYSEDMNTLLGFTIIPVDSIPTAVSTLTLTSKDLTRI
jgi:AraC-like DNA-binding protein